MIIEGVLDLSESTCITTGEQGLSLSVSYVTGCCQQCGGCDGGDPNEIWAFLMQNGTVPKDCYIQGVSSCSLTKCADGSPVKFYKAKVSTLTTVTAMQMAILTTGPIAVAVDATGFEFYDGGIMDCSTSGKQIDDVVTLLGWGVQGGTKYWIGANSWGTGWGMEGYFLIERGVNACGIEEEDWSVTAA